MDFISLIIPAYNRETYIGAAIQSALCQTRPPDEVLVIDDGSTDRTAEITRSFGKTVRCLSQSNQGIGAARNAGIEFAQGNWIAFLDSDDLWLERKLEIQMAYCLHNPDIDLVACHMKPFLSPEINPTAAPPFDDRPLAACAPSCVLLRRDLFLRVGPLDTDRRGGEFIAWFGRAQEKNLRYAILPDILVHRRVHLSNTVLDRQRMNSDYAFILKRQLDRRREVTRGK